MPVFSFLFLFLPPLPMKSALLSGIALVSATLLLTACSPSSQTPTDNEPMMPSASSSTVTPTPSTAPIHHMSDGTMMSGATMSGMDMSGTGGMSHHMSDGTMMSGSTMTGMMDMSR